MGLDRPSVRMMMRLVAMFSGKTEILARGGGGCKRPLNCALRIVDLEIVFRVMNRVWPLAVALAMISPSFAAEPAASPEPFAWRGYYFILSRNPGYGLEDSKLILDRMAEDRANSLILWIGGGFPSKRYPETGDYNRSHTNCRENFAGARIHHAPPARIKALPRL